MWRARRSIPIRKSGGNVEHNKNIMKQNLNGALVLLAVCLLLPLLGSMLHAQPAGYWRAGLNIGLNYNQQALGLQQLSPGNVPNFFPFVLVDGTGVGPYLGALGEYRSTSWWGGQLRVSYDSRNALSTDNSPLIPQRTFDTRLSYLTIEPMLRLQPEFLGKLFVTVGPMIAINMSGSFDHTPAPGAAVASDLPITDLKGVAFGWAGGFGYDLALGNGPSGSRWFLTPFLEGSYLAHQRMANLAYLDQDSFDDIWSTFTVRGGVALKLGFNEGDALMAGGGGPLDFRLYAPSKYVDSRRYEEYFPLVTSVFFDSASAEIPSRYDRLAPAEARAFSESGIVEPPSAGAASLGDRMQRQMSVYYDVMNIIGSRMAAAPASTVTLIGSAPGARDGGAMAERVRNYLVASFGIDSSRVAIDGRELPRVPSGSPRTPVDDRPLVDAENRRVELATRPDLGGPITIKSVNASPVENNLVLSISDRSDIRTWQLVVSGEGRRITYGPFSRPVQRIDPRPLMDGLSHGAFTAEAVAVTNTGERLTQTTTFELSRRDAPAKPARRYSIIFDYGQDDPVRAYEKFLRTTVAPQIEPGSTVYVLGHTDNVGDASLNYNLSLKRSGEVRDILRSETAKRAGEVNFELIGYGEEESSTTFDNAKPEGRFYNRGVIIEVVPAE